MIKGRRIIEIIAVLIAISFITYQVVTSYTSAITTESAVYFEHSEGVELNGVVIRSEQPVSLSDEGTLHFVVADGERVAKGGTIAKVYTDDKASAAATRIAEIDKRLASIEDIEGYNNVSAVDMNTVNAKIDDSLEDFLFSVADRRFDGAAEAKDSLLTALTRKQVITGENTDFATVKQQLSDEKAKLSSVMGNAKSECKAEYSGYFVSMADGFESVLTTDDISKYTPELLSSLEPKPVEDKVIGKIVHDYEWYIAVTVPLNDSMSYKSGDSMKLKIESADTVVTATVKTVNYAKESNEAAVIFACTEMSGRLAGVRSGRVTVIKNEYTGLKISSKAVRISNGVTGVYVVSGLEIKFVAINILYDNEEYTICELNTVEENKLRLYDEVIVRGRGLYDGKIIY